MSLLNALRFISLIREDKPLAAEIERAESFESICAVAASRGIAFTPDEFLRAFGHEWSIRWMAGKAMRDTKSKPAENPTTGGTGQTRT